MIGPSSSVPVDRKESPVQDRIATASLEIEADAATIFELIADPSRQPEWDGNDNLASAAPGQRIRGVGSLPRRKQRRDRCHRQALPQ